MRDETYDFPGKPSSCASCAELHRLVEKADQRALDAACHSHCVDAVLRQLLEALDESWGIS